MRVWHVVGSTTPMGATVRATMGTTVRGATVRVTVGTTVGSVGTTVRATVGTTTMRAVGAAVGWAAWKVTREACRWAEGEW